MVKLIDALKARFSKTKLSPGQAAKPLCNLVVLVKSRPIAAFAVAVFSLIGIYAPEIKAYLDWLEPLIVGALD